MKPLRRKGPYSLWVAALIAVLMTMAAILPTASAQGNPTPAPTRAVTDNDVNRVSHNLYCPVCQNVPLEVCETEACARWRDQVRDLLAQGYTDEQVRQYFIDHFGTKTVGTPADPLAQALTVALPFALVALIGAVIVLTLLRWQRRPDLSDIQLTSEEATRLTSEETRPAPDDYRARLEEEIRGGE
jgi:cytochrome c-type biogenesis protein CcmH